MSSPLVWLVAALACLGLTTCSSAAGPAATAPPGNTEPAATATGHTAIRIVVGDETIDATLRDDPAARSLIEQLPLTLEFSDYGRQEVLAEPPQSLTMDGVPAGESAPAGTIGYYAPGGVVVLYYRDVGRFDGIVRIGEMSGDLTVLTGWNESRSVTIEIAE